jgi:hypothetical protein
MKKLIILFLFIANIVVAQTDKNGNPVFNSISITEENIDGYMLSSNYYTLHNNIENNKSSVFLSKAPTLNEVEKAAINLQSNFFIVVKKGRIINMISLKQQSGIKLTILNPYTRKVDEADSDLEGDITETRANEVLKNKYDTTARIENGYLFFNNNKLKIIPYTAIKKAVINLIVKQKLDKEVPDGIEYISQTEIRKKILTASKNGGQLDFWTPIQGHEYDGIQIEPGIFATKLHAAYAQWAFNVIHAGISGEDALFSLYAELAGRAVTEREKSYLLYGFKKALENQ